MEKNLFLNKEKYNGTIVGLFLCADMLIKLITYALPFKNILIFYYLLIIAVSLLVNKAKLNIKYILFYILVTLIFAFSFYKVPDTTYTLQYFTYFSCFYLAGNSLQFKVDIKQIFKVINITNIFYSLYLFLVVLKQYKNNSLDMDTTMDLSYTSLIGVASFLLTLFLVSYGKHKLYFFVNGLFVLFELYFMIFISNNRGALMALSVLLVLLIVRKIKKTKIRFLALSFISIISFYFFTNIYDILLYFFGLSSKFNISANFLTKSINSLSSGNFNSGRTEIYDSAISLFKIKPIFGNGVGNFSSLNNGQYPHNILLESLTDSGIFITLILVSFLFFCVYKLIKSKQNDVLILVLFLFSLSLPRLAISSSMWLSPFFWSLVIIFVINPNLNNIGYSFNKIKKTTD